MSYVAFTRRWLFETAKYIGGVLRDENIDMDRNNYGRAAARCTCSTETKIEAEVEQQHWN
jgi:hypothetical protein